MSQQAFITRIREPSVKAASAIRTGGSGAVRPSAAMTAGIICSPRVGRNAEGEWYGGVEDPLVWWDGQGYELIAKDMSGRITGEQHVGVHGLSADGIAWRLADPPKAYSRTRDWDDGDRAEQGCLERPQQL